MLTLDSDRVLLSGVLNADTATACLAQGVAALDAATASPVVFDFHSVERVDSAALSVVFAWIRHAHTLKRQIKLANPPQQLLSLAAVYGVGELLPVS